MGCRRPTGGVFKYVSSDTSHAEAFPVATPRGRSVSFPTRGTMVTYVTWNVFQLQTTVSVFSCYAKCLLCSWSSQLASGRNYSCLVMCLYMSLLLLPLYLCPMSRLMLIEIWALSVCKTTLCQHVNSCTRRNKSKTTTLANHMVQRAERNGYAGQRRICGVLTRIFTWHILCFKINPAAKLWVLFIPNSHCHGYNV